MKKKDRERKGGGGKNGINKTLMEKRIFLQNDNVVH